MTARRTVHSETYDNTIEVMNAALTRSRVDRRERAGAHRRLAKLPPGLPEADGFP